MLENLVVCSVVLISLWWLLFRYIKRLKSNVESGGCDTCAGCQNVDACGETYRFTLEQDAEKMDT